MFLKTSIVKLYNNTKKKQGWKISQLPKIRNKTINKLWQIFKKNLKSKDILCKIASNPA